MQSLEMTCNEGEHAVERFKSLPVSSLKWDCQPSSASSERSSSFDLYEALQEMYEEDDENDDDNDEADKKASNSSSNIEKLVNKKALNTLIFNLYSSPSQEYSMQFRIQNHITMQFEEATVDFMARIARIYKRVVLLRYLDNAEVPPFVISDISKFGFLFYNGCMIAEIRQFNDDRKFFSKFVLLQLSQRTILKVTNSELSDRSDLSESLRLEKEILDARAPRLCLDPDPNLENKAAITFNRTRTPRVERKPRTRRKRKASETVFPGTELFHFLKKRRLVDTIDISKTVIPVPELKVSPDLAAPSGHVGVNVNSGWLPWPKNPIDDCSLRLLGEYKFETDFISKDTETSRVFYTKLTIFQRTSDLRYCGQLYLDRDYKEGLRDGATCKFLLGSWRECLYYIHQFSDIITEGGGKSVRFRCDLPHDDSCDVSWLPRVLPRSGDVSNLSVLLPRLPLAQMFPDWLDQMFAAHLKDRPPIVNGVRQCEPNNLYKFISTKKPLPQQEQQKIDALAADLEISSQPFLPETARRQVTAAQHLQQQQRLLSNSNIISLLNSSPMNNNNGLGAIAVGNAIKRGVAAPQRLLAKKVIVNSDATTKVVKHPNFITVNSHNQLNLQHINAQLSRPQTVTLTSVNNGASFSYATLPLKQEVVHYQRSPQAAAASNHHVYREGECVLDSLLIGTGAANRPEIVNNSNCTSDELLLEKLAANSGTGGGQSIFAQTPKNQHQQQQQPSTTRQFIVQSSKGNAVISPMSSPPPQASNTHLNVQSLNFAHLQGIPVQLQVQNVGAQSISVPQSFIIQQPQSQHQQQQQPQQQQSQQQGTSIQGVVVNASGASQIARMVSAGAVKHITHHNLRTTPSGGQTLQLGPGTAQFHMMQMPSRQQPQALQGRTLERTLKVGTQNANQPGIVGNIQQYQPIPISRRSLEERSRLKTFSTEQP